MLVMSLPKPAHAVDGPNGKASCKVTKPCKHANRQRTATSRLPSVAPLQVQVRVMRPWRMHLPPATASRLPFLGQVLALSLGRHTTARAFALLDLNKILAWRFPPPTAYSTTCDAPSTLLPSPDVAAPSCLHVPSTAIT